MAKKRGASPPGPLTELRVGSQGTISALGADADTRRQLYSLGFVEGEEVRVVGRAPLGGAVLVQIGSSQYALGPEVARKIRVLPG